MVFIFDWDGTLSDSVTRIVNSMQAAIAELSLEPLADAEIAEIVGLGLPEAIQTLFPKRSGTERASIQAAYARHYVAAEVVPCAFFPQALETLVALRAAGWRLAVATGKSRKGLNRVLQNLGLSGFFDATRCADETRSKPHPQMLQELLAELAVAPHEAIMVGDTEYDLAMAQAAGCHRVGVTFGAHTASRLHAYAPLMMIDRLEQLATCRLPQPTRADAGASPAAISSGAQA